MNTENTFLMIRKEDLMALVAVQQDILQQLKELNSIRSTDVTAPYMTAQQFMDTVKIRRTKFDDLRMRNMIKVIKKRRKLYVPRSEIERYFNDPGIQ